MFFLAIFVLIYHAQQSCNFFIDIFNVANSHIKASFPRIISFVSSNLVEIIVFNFIIFRFVVLVSLDLIVFIPFS